jgi:hypothetical protein
MQVDLTPLVKLDRRLKRASLWMKLLAVFAWGLLLMLLLIGRLMTE